MEKEFTLLLEKLPESIPCKLTFLEIGGYAHHENLCSNLLKFYFNPTNNLHGLSNLVLKSFLQSCGNNTSPFDNFVGLQIRREVVTKNGRIDLLLFTSNWVIAVENKLNHNLKNDLEEYAAFIDEEFEGREKLKVVLSLRDETKNLKGNFINIRYKNFIDHIENNLQFLNQDITNQYFLFFNEFIQSLKNMYIIPKMDDTQLKFLIDNRDKISELLNLEENFSNYIFHRSNYIKDKVIVEDNVEKWVYDAYDIGFHYNFGSSKYKLECLIEKQGISIVACVEPNRASIKELNKLEYFKKRISLPPKYNQDNSRVIIEENIDFFTSDDDIVKKLQNLLSEFKILQENNV